MAQRLIGYNSRFSLDDLSDVRLTNPEDFHILVKQGLDWVNLPIDIINPFTLRVQVVSADFFAESNTIYIVNTKDGPVNCLLPAAPFLGDRIMFIDAKSAAPNNDCNVGWGTNPFTITANINSNVLGSPYVNQALDGDCIHLIYNSCDTWGSMTPVVRQANELIAGIARIGTTNEVLLGISDILIVTPLKLKQALEVHKEDILNTIFPLPDASESVKGILRFSTITEVRDGILDNVGVSPARLQDKFNEFSPLNFTVRGILTAQGKLATPLVEANSGVYTSLTTNTLNILSAMVFPYNVTFTATVDVSDATVVGLRYASMSQNGVIRLATQSEVNTGLDALTSVTPLTLQNKLDQALRRATESIVGVTKLATASESLNYTNNEDVTTPAKVKYILENVETSNRDLIPRGQEAVYGTMAISTQSLVNGGVDDLTSVSPLKLAVRLNSFKDELMDLVDAALSQFELRLDNFDLQLTALAARVKVLEDRRPIRVLDNFASIQATIGNNVSGNVIANDVGSQLKVVSYAFLGNMYAPGTNNVLYYGTFSLTQAGLFTYTIINNTFTQNLNDASPVGTNDVVTIQYFVEDNQNQVGSGYLFIRVSQKDNALPEIIGEIIGANGVEAQTNDIIYHLPDFFVDPEGSALTYSVTFNSNGSKINAFVDPNNPVKLNISFPIWTSDFNTTQAATITVSATDGKGATSSITFTATAEALERKFEEEYYRVRNLPIAEEYGVNLYLYVSFAELTAILNNSAYDTQYEYIANDPPVFKAMNAASPFASQKAYDANIIEKIYRLQRNDKTPRGHGGRYIYVGELEKNQIFNNPSYAGVFTNEGVAYIAFRSAVNRGAVLERYQYTSNDFDEDGNPISQYSDYSYRVFNQPVPSGANFEGVLAKILMI